MKIIYVHHAQREKRILQGPDDDITKLGENDAENVGQIINDIYKKIDKLDKVKAIYTSPFLRCLKTAQIINKYLNIELIEDSRLNEMGAIKNETWVEFQNRVTDSLYDIVCKYSDDDIVICVTSGVNLVAFTNLAYKVKPSMDAPYMMVPSCSVVGFNINKSNFKM